jgi:hypothetical protein
MEQLMTIEAAKQAEINLEQAKEKCQQAKRNLGKIIKEERKRHGMTQRQTEEWFKRNGLKVSIHQAEKAYKGQSYSIDTQIKIIKLLHTGSNS